MRIPRVYFEGTLNAGAEAELSRDQAHYLGRVLRLKPGSEIVLFNGDEGEYLCQIAELDGKRGSISVREHRYPGTESPLDICLAIGLSKGDRFDWAIQKATELGVTSIQPLHTERTEVRLSEDRLEKKMSHWRGVVTSACEQSGRTKVPVVLAPQSLEGFVAAQSVDLALVLDPEATLSLAKVAPEPGFHSLSLLVGPEGGFSRSEMDLLSKHSYVAVGMGPRTMRTETAPVAALAVIQSRWGDW